MVVSRRDFIALSAAATAVSGCTTLPGASVVYSGAHAVGSAVGLVLMECNLSDKSKEAIVSVATKIVAVVPDVGQSAEEAWRTVAKDHVALLIASGKVSSLHGAIALAAFTIIVKAFEILETRYTAALAVVKVLEAAIDGFGKGILARLTSDASASQTYDVDAYGSMKSSTLLSVIRMLDQYDVSE